MHMPSLRPAHLGLRASVLILTGACALSLAHAADAPAMVRSRAAVTAFEGEYALAPLPKAFAHSPMGAWAQSSGQASQAAARADALARCNAKVSAMETPCVLVDLDGSEPEGAVAEYEALIQRHGDAYLDAMLNAILRNSASEFGEYQRALGRLARAQSVPTARAAERYHSGLRLMRDADYAGAAAAFEAGARLSPGMQALQYVHGVSLLQLNRLDEAEAAFRRALRLSQANVDGWVGLALARYLRGDKDAAQAAVLAAFRVARPPSEPSVAFSDFPDRNTVLAQIRSFAERERDEGMRAVYAAALQQIDDDAKRLPPVTPVDASPAPARARVACVKPPYPRKALREMRQGMVMVSAFVNAGGELTDTLLVQSSGSDILDAATMDALKDCHIPRPPGVAIDQPFWQTIRYVWVLKRD